MLPGGPGWKWPLSAAGRAGPAAGEEGKVLSILASTCLLPPQPQPFSDIVPQSRMPSLLYAQDQVQVADGDSTPASGSLSLLGSEGPRALTTHADLN